MNTSDLIYILENEYLGITNKDQLTIGRDLLEEIVMVLKIHKLSRELKKGEKL